LPRKSINRLLEQLDEAKRRFGPTQPKQTEKLLARLARIEITDAAALIRLHEILLFLSAYPQSPRVRQLAESLLKGFGKRVEALRKAEGDLSDMDEPEVSGIAGTSVTDNFTYPIVRWLLKRHPTQVSIDWDWFEEENRLAETWPRFMPLLEEDGFVEANVPYQSWLRAAKGRNSKELVWLIQRFEALRKTDREKAELYDSQYLFVRWTPAYRATRTGMRLARLKGSEVFYHRGPLIQRREVSLRDELRKPKPAFERVSPKQGEAILDMAKEASTVRYRELYGFTHGDPERVLKVHIGRGVDIFVMGLPPDKRLPLRAYHAALIFKNGVPVGYFEGLSLFERMESGFNLYYTFRDGETAWLYARTLHIFRHLLGVTAFTLDPYQIGYENEEGIESGAFWFYRKLGFRPTKPDVMKLVLNEEKKIAARRTYRTSARTLRKLAHGTMIFELDESLDKSLDKSPDKSPDKSRPGDWDRFAVRNIGLAAARLVAAKFEGDAERFRAHSVKTLTRLLGISTNSWGETELSVLSDFAVPLSLVHDLSRWDQNEQRALRQIIRAKAGTDESKYLKLTQKHKRLRSAMIRLGS
jgi:hypothetical protein